ncbi:TMEM175 family protein [Myxococcus stipitatus]|uniref:TMEM175 family protein n=1 Tax=Myxococcus stipitatus TaxID=83455 RepID=UPI00314546ED
MNTGPQAEYHSSLRTSRIEALSDEVFAIAMTLLVLHIEVPDLHGTGTEILHSLLGLWPKFLSYIVGFVTLGVYWMGQHVQFHFIKRANQPFLWLTILFLMLIAAIPFSVRLIGQYFHLKLVVVLYGCHLVAIGLAHYSIWRYATAQRRLVDAELSWRVIQTQSRLAFIPVGVYLAAIVVTALNTVASIIIYAVVPSIYIVMPHLFAKYHRQRT